MNRTVPAAVVALAALALCGCSTQPRIGLVIDGSTSDSYVAGLRLAAARAEVELLTVTADGAANQRAAISQLTLWGVEGVAVAHRFDAGAEDGAPDDVPTVVGSEDAASDLARLLAEVDGQ